MQGWLNPFLQPVFKEAFALPSEARAGTGGEGVGREERFCGRIGLGGERPTFSSIAADHWPFVA